MRLLFGSPFLNFSHYHPITLIIFAINRLGFVKVIIFSQTIESKSLPQIDELEYTIVPDTTRPVSAFAAENGNRFVFINAESDEESVQEELMK